jgi:aspartate aminotransferase
LLANHHAVLKNVGIQPVEYPYYDPKTIGLDYTGLMGTLESALPGSVFLLHACAHNPTGVDPTEEQWKAIAEAMVKKKHYAFFDCAYQGFASGDLDRDAWAVRYFMNRGVPMLVCQVGVDVACGWCDAEWDCRVSQRMQGCTGNGLGRFTLLRRRKRRLRG